MRGRDHGSSQVVEVSIDVRKRTVAAPGATRLRMVQMKRFAAIAALLISSISLRAQTPTAAQAQASHEIDVQIWDVLIDTVAKGDIVRMASTYAPDAVLVEPRITKSVKSALDGWGKDMVTAKANGSRATVEFRFTRRQDDSTTAFEAGLFNYTVIDKAGVSKPVYVPFEELLAKVNGKWLILMERQFTPVAQAEWDKLAK